ncbi:MAG: hypothetical protein V1779_00120 [bacterium]
MISEVIKNHNMVLNLETYWIQLRLDGISRYSKPFEAVSIQIIWDDVSPIYDGVIELHGTNDQNSSTLLTSFNVNTLSNRANSILYELSPAYEFFKLKYIKNSILTGKLNVIVRYREKE